MGTVANVVYTEKVLIEYLFQGGPIAIPDDVNDPWIRLM